MTCNQIETVRYLLHSNVDTEVTDSLGFTAQQLARNLGLESIIELFAFECQTKHSTIPVVKSESHINDCSTSDTNELNN